MKWTQTCILLVRPVSSYFLAETTSCWANDDPPKYQTPHATPQKHVGTRKKHKTLTSYCHHVNAKIIESRRPRDNNHCCLFATKDSSLIYSSCWLFLWGWKHGADFQPCSVFYLISFLAWSGTFSAPSSPDQKPPIMQFARFLLKWVRMQRGWERVHFNNTQRLELETSKNKQQPCFNSPWRPRTNCRWRQKLCWRISFKYSWVKWVWTGTRQPCSGLKDTTSRSVEPTCDDRLPHCYTCSGSVETFL